MKTILARGRAVRGQVLALLVLNEPRSRLGLTCATVNTSSFCGGEGFRTRWVGRMLFIDAIALSGGPDNEEMKNIRWL